MKPAAWAAIALLVATPATAAPVKSGGNRDVRCLMVSNLFAKAAPNATGKAAAAQSRLFYLGRVSLKYTQPQLQAAMDAEAKRIDPGKVGADMNGCVASVQAAAAAVETAGTKAREAVIGTTPPRPAVAGPRLPVGR